MPLFSRPDFAKMKKDREAKKANKPAVKAVRAGLRRNSGLLGGATRALTNRKARMAKILNNQ